MNIIVCEVLFFFGRGRKENENIRQKTPNATERRTKMKIGVVINLAK